MIIDPVADPRSTVVRGRARFTILSPTLVRLEWSPDGAFEDRASLTVIDRATCCEGFDVRAEDGWLTISTSCLALRYRADGERFASDNLVIEPRPQAFGDRFVPFSWHPGKENLGNLGGTCRTLDNISGRTALEDGLLSREGWTLLDDSDTVLLDGDPPWPTPRRRPDAIDWYFFAYGHDYRRCLADFTQVAGRVPLPPRFVFGGWWSRYWDYTADELKQLVADFRAHDVPLDVLVIDMDWHLPGWTGYTWNPKYFPDPPGFLKWAHEQGLRVTLNLHPSDGVGRHEAAFEAMCADLGLDPKTTERIPFDCTDRRFVESYFKRLHYPLEQQGVDFWWMDWQQGSDTRLPGVDPLFWLNHLHWTDFARDPAKRGRQPLIFSRWGGLGSHRYPIGFSGDAISDWASLRFQVEFTATAANVCFGYWSHDIGGHQPGPVDPELYVRWIQFGVFSPILRTHTTRSADAERRIWKLPPAFYEAAKEAWRLRYALLPYIERSAREASETGVSICRPLYYDWPEIEAAYQHPAQYLFGDDLLVAPVTEPIDPATASAKFRAWIPPGTWLNWFTGAAVRGPGYCDISASLREMAVFIREGRSIPLDARFASAPLVERAANAARYAHSATTLQDISAVAVRGHADRTAEGVPIAGLTSARCTSIDAWQVLGPFAPDDADLLDPLLSKAERIDFARAIAGHDGAPRGWRPVVRSSSLDARDEFAVDVWPVVNPPPRDAVRRRPQQPIGAIAYAATCLIAPVATPAVLCFNSYEETCLWLGGREVWRGRVPWPYLPKQERAEVTLRPGVNVLLLRTRAIHSGWRFCVHLEGRDGRPLPAIRASIAD